MAAMCGLSERHSLVWLSASGWNEALTRDAGAHCAVLRTWQTHDWPLVVRRRDADSMENEICLGIALPPDEDGLKLRVPVRVLQSGVRRARAPLSLAEAIGHALPVWRQALHALHADAQELRLHVFGSLALQVLTGRSYLRAASDIDILFIPRDGRQLQQGMALLACYAAQLPLDGEVLFPDDAAVSWKEWAQACRDPDNRVLAKRRGDVALLRVGDLSAELKEAACQA